MPITDFIIPEKGRKTDIQRTHQTMPKLLRIIAAKRSHVLPTINSKFQNSEMTSDSVKIITTVPINQEEIPEEKIILQEHTSAEITEEIKADGSIVPETSVTAIEMSVEGAPKDIADKDKILKDIQDETTKIYVPCPQKKPGEELQKSCKCGLPSDSSARPCSIAKYAKDHVLCPQKKSEEESQKSVLCKRELAFNYSIIIHVPDVQSAITLSTIVPAKIISSDGRKFIARVAVYRRCDASAYHI